MRSKRFELLSKKSSCNKIEMNSGPCAATLKPLLICLHVSFAAAISAEPINFHFLPGLIDETYSQLGDINIGAIMMVKDGVTNKHAQDCHKSNVQAPALDKTEAVAFAVDMINRDPNLLPNVTIGFVVKGACYSNGLVLGTSLSFLPRTHRVCSNSSNGTMCVTQPTMSSDSRWSSHDVIGILSPARSSYTLPISILYSVARLPIMGYVVTSDDLSDKSMHPYFFRIVPPDRYQVQAMLRFISANGWSYISVVYLDDPYGQKAYDYLYAHIDQFGICIASSHRLNSFLHYDDLVADLILNSRARVVVLFVERTPFRGILEAVDNRNATGHFIWIGSDFLFKYPGSAYTGDGHDPAIGTFLFDIYSTHIPEFYDHLRNMRVATTANPWLKSAWEILLECSFDRGTCAPNGNIFTSSKYRPSKLSALIIDSVLTFAHATHNLLSRQCPNARGQEARSCVTENLLLDYLKNTTFDGFCGRVEFDENQEVKKKYKIKQLVYDYPETSFLPGTNATQRKQLFWKHVGTYDTNKNTIDFFDEISWSHLKTLDSIAPWWNEASMPIEVEEIPESICSKPCLKGEYKIEKKLSCCWDCRRCRDNEFLVDGSTSCQVCPLFTWPDPSTAFTSCVDIPYTYPKMVDTLPLLLTSVAIFAQLVTFVISVFYVIYRNERVIKASSKELSVIQLAAIFTGYTTVILFQTTPTQTMCTAIFLLFSMSFVLLYSPLLIKTIRIYRIFQSGTKNQKPRFISPSSQVTFAVLLINGQVGLCLFTYIMYSPGVQRTQPVRSEKMVELSCDLTLPGLTSFLGYNIFLVSLCSAFAFTVRKLPDNFNESKFISMCVASSLLVWLAFIPTFLSADREYVRAFLLSTALLINHSVALIFLFVPKIYAVVFVLSNVETFSGNQSS